MKKFAMVFVCLMTMVVFSSCGNVNEDVEKASEQVDTFIIQCAKDHAESDAEQTFNAIVVNKKGAKSINSDSLIKSVSNDGELIFNECFGPLFEKYGEKKTLKALRNYIATKDYKGSTVKVEDISKEKIRDAIVANVLAKYTKMYKCNLDLKMSEYKLEMLRKRF